MRQGATSGGNEGNNNDDNRPVCHVCGKVGHVALKCCHRFDHSYQAAEGHVTAFANNNSYAVDTNWYSDTSTTDHIKSDLDRLTMHEQYHGKDQIWTTNGLGLSILLVGHS